MRETMMRDAVTPVDDTGLPLLAFALGTAKLYPAPQLARFVLRARGENLQKAASAWGVALPDALRVASHKDRHLLWQGPDEFLLLALLAEVGDITRSLAAAMADAPYSLVDVSQRNARGRRCATAFGNRLHAGSGLGNVSGWNDNAHAFRQSRCDHLAARYTDVPYRTMAVFRALCHGPAAAKRCCSVRGLA